MQKIYPKTCENLNGEENLREYIRKYKGVEIQYFHKDQNKLVDFEMTPAIEKMMSANPEIEEITIHPPLGVEYNIENILGAGNKLFFKLLDDMINLSEKYQIEINMVLHSDLSYEAHKYCTMSALKEAKEILKGKKVRLLLENLFMFYGMERFYGLDVCKDIDSENIKICIDMCHLYCRAHIVKMPIEEFLKTYLDKELCQKYVHQIHFADTKENDGYIKKETHGRAYDSIQKIKYDLDLLKEYGMENKRIVVEVSEDDYSSRKDQIKEIKLIEEIYNQ